MGESNGSFSLEECLDDSKWDSLVRSSREANPFLMSAFLKSIGKDKSRRILFEGANAVLGTCIFQIPQDGKELENEFYLYQGVFFPGIKDSNYQDDNERLRLLGALINALDKIGNPLLLSFHPSVNDIRGVDWYYYQNLECKLRATQKIQYTGQIRTGDFLDFNDYAKSIRKVRLDELKKTHQLGVKVIRGSDRIDHFMELYRLTFSRQSIPISDAMISRVEKIIKDSNSNLLGSLDIAYSKSGAPLSGVFILSDENTDIYLFGATDPQYRKEFGSTRLILDAIERSFSDKKSIFDLCGMNSPKRGAYKASFNSRVVPYYEIELGLKI
jgi:hypothetical protein